MHYWRVDSRQEEEVRCEKPVDGMKRRKMTMSCYTHWLHQQVSVAWTQHSKMFFKKKLKPNKFFLHWLMVEEGSTSHSRHSLGHFRDDVLQVWWPNQQCQSTEGVWLVIQTGLSLTRLTSPCYNNTTWMRI